MSELICCTPKSLPRELWDPAARTALKLNPANHPHTALMARALAGGPAVPARIALLVGKRWPAAGVKLTVAFLDSVPADLRKRILAHMNAWAKSANVLFKETKSHAQVRIARAGSPPVVRHETGHTLGFPHEHMRRELVNKIDPDQAIAYFGQTQGWSPDEVREQVLTPLEESSLLGTACADPHSIMCYQIPGTLTKDGKAITGGKDIDKRDYAFAASVYPKKTT